MILAKCQSMLKPQKLLFYGFQMHKLKVLKARTNFAIHYFIVLTADISEIAATEGSYVMEGLQ
jgi:hypothetical protein